MKRKAKRLKKYSNRTGYQNSIKKILYQSLTVLIFSVIGESITGSVLVGMKEKITLIPGLLIIVPALTDLRGNVGAAFGERLSTMLHLGIIKPKFAFSEIIKQNIFASFSLTAFVAFIIGMSAPLFSKLFHIKSSSPLTLSFISTSAGIISSLVLLPIVFFLVLAAYRHNIDPDNIVAPTLPVIGDIVTVSAIYLASIVALKFVKVSAIPLIIALFLLTNGFKKRKSFPKRYHYFPILKQSIPVLLICLSIGITSGIFLQSAEKTFALFPLMLSLVPQVIAQGGSIGGIVGSRVSTSLYLGTAKPFVWNKEVIKNFTAGIIMGVAIGPFIAVVSFIAGIVTKTPLVPFTKILVISSASMAILSILTGILAIYTAFFSFKIKLDPSNVVIPLITSMGDIAGVLVLLFVIKLILL
ncbi:MAG: magnesium transporter [Caldisericaceae bacterium]|nr:magnesium transporter [Caldisericaceae bacterium]